MLALVILQSVVLAALTVLVIGLLRSHGDVLRRLHELGVPLEGTAALESETADIARRVQDGVAPPKTGATTAVSDVSGVTPAGGALSVGLMGSGRLTMLAFLSSGCTTCAGFWQALRSGERLQLAGRAVRIVVVTGAPEHEHPRAVGALASPEVTVVMSGEAWSDYGVPATPYFVLVDGERGVIGEGSAAGWPQLAGLVERAAADGGFIDLTADDRAADDRIVRSTDPVAAGGPERERRADAALLRVGIGPGDTSLYESPLEPLAGSGE